MPLDLIFRHQGASAPDASVLMPLFNSACMVGEAIESVLSQCGCVLDVLLSDDSSQDETFSQAQAYVEGYKGPHSVRLFRAKRRLGIDHLQALVDQAVCGLLIEAHGDDVSLPGRMARLLAIYHETGASLIVSLVDRRHGLTDSISPERLRAGMVPGWLSTDQCIPPNGNGILAGARYAFDRSIHDDFPRLESQFIPSSHDRIQAFRACLRKGVWFTQERLLQYRLHEGQGSHALTDEQCAAASGFGWSLRHLSAIRAMQQDVIYARTQCFISEEQAETLRQLLFERSNHFLEKLLNCRDDLVRADRQALWVPAADVLKSNTRQKRHP